MNFISLSYNIARVTYTTEPLINHTLILEIHNRHPNVETRISFNDVVHNLQKSDYSILKWKPEDLETYSQETRAIGSPLELGQELYKDLQHVYLAKPKSEPDKGDEH